MIATPPAFDVTLVPWIDCISGTVTIDIVLESMDGAAWCHAVDLALSWDPAVLQLRESRTDRASVPSTISGMPGFGIPLEPWDFYGANWDLDDGSGYFLWLGPLTGASDPLLIERECIGSIVFDIIDPTVKTVVSVDDVAKGVNFPYGTHVYAGSIPGYDAFSSSKGGKVASCLPWYMVIQ